MVSYFILFLPSKAIVSNFSQFGFLGLLKGIRGEFL